MRFRILFTCITLLFLQTAYAKEVAIPLDLLELLGDIDDSDSELLETSISELELKAAQNKPNNGHTQTMESGQSKTMPQEIRK